MARFESPSTSVACRGSADGDAKCTVVWLRGDHDTATRATLEAEIAGAADLEHVDLLIDLSAVTFMDASTIGALVACRNRLHPRAQSVHLRAPSPIARRVLELCGLSHLVVDPPTNNGVREVDAVDAGRGGP